MNIKNKLSSLMYAPLALALLAACSSDDVLENNQPTTQGQTLTINATTGSEDGTRTIYGLETGGKYEVITSKWDKANDKVIVFGNSNAANKAEFNVSALSSDELSATLTGTLPTKLEHGKMVNAYIANGDVITVNNDNQIEVDYSDQDGTWQGAVKKSVLYGSATYNAADGDNIPNLKFAYKTAFFKLTLTFPEVTTNTTASLCITGEKLASKSRINTVYNKGGGTNKVVDAGSINIPSVTINDKGEAVVYFALYPQKIKNTQISAELADGSIYTFEVIPASKEVQINNGFFYQFGRTGTKIGNKNELPTVFKGAGTEKSPYEIATIFDLMKLQKDVADGNNYNGKCFRMTSDITINGEWKAIGDYLKMFRGKFDGARHSILGTMKFSSLADNGMAGLFGCVGPNGVIKNLTNKANVTVENSANQSSFVGGIVGRIRKNVTILNCANIGNITANVGTVGGVVGEAYIDTYNSELETRIEACYNTGDITNTSTFDATTYVGGVIAHPALKSKAKDTPPVDHFVIIGCYNKDNTIVAAEKTKSCGGGVVGSTNGTQTSANNDFFLIKACWNSSQSIEAKNVGLIASSASKSGFVMDNCWVKGKKFTNGGEYAEFIECYNNTNSTLAERIDAMNTAWGSTEYMFDTKGNIVNK
ncbi:hypothetical protein [Prevotella sp.]|uniref:hypothetical protein n=1 Tax=Prevotella sp. TaxID=59823 RepID=UPI0027E2DACF|nr:hypothetical protein [Prevotella sp.]